MSKNKIFVAMSHRHKPLDLIVLSLEHLETIVGLLTRPNINIVVPLGIGMPEEGVRDGGTAGWWNRQTHTTFIKFAVLYRRCSWRPKTIVILLLVGWY
jgi:hypothetical protein